MPVRSLPACPPAAPKIVLRPASVGLFGECKVLDYSGSCEHVSKRGFGNLKIT